MESIHRNAMRDDIYERAATKLNVEDELVIQVLLFNDRCSYPSFEYSNQPLLA